MSRRTKCTPEVTASICKLVKAGVTISASAAIEGVGETTIHDWRERGRTGEEPFATFCEQLEASLAHAESVITQNVISMAAEDWRAGAWWLERRRARDYGNKVDVAHSADETMQAALGKLGDALERKREGR